METFSLIKEKYNLNSLKKLIKLNHDIIRELLNGKMVKVVEQRGTCWLADDDLSLLNILEKVCLLKRYLL